MTDTKPKEHESEAIQAIGACRRRLGKSPTLRDVLIFDEYIALERVALKLQTERDDLRFKVQVLESKKT